MKTFSLLILVLCLVNQGNAADIYQQKPQLAGGSFSAKCTIKIVKGVKVRTFSLETERTSLKYIDDQCWQAAKRLKGPDSKIRLVKWEAI